MAPDAPLVVAVLAAGASRRLGSAKQLVSIAGEPLLHRQCRSALTADVGRVVAILGWHAHVLQPVISDLPVDVHINEEWAEGVSATLRCAVRAAEHSRALLVLPCDQYRITPADLRVLVQHWRVSPSTACVSRWDRFVGPPAILPVEYHDEILALHGDIGARCLLYGSARLRPTEVLNPRAIFDLDSPEDLKTVEIWSAGMDAGSSELVALLERLHHNLGTCLHEVMTAAVAKRTRLRGALPQTSASREN